MINRIGLAIVLAVAIGLAAFLLGLIFLLVGSGAPLLVAVGTFLEKFCWLLGVLAGAWFLFSGRTSLR